MAAKKVVLMVSLMAAKRVERKADERVAKRELSWVETKVDK